MRHLNYVRFAPTLWFCIVLALLLGGCEEDNDVQAPVTSIASGGYDPVFNADGGFVITYGMLDKRYNEITFPGTHNSFAGPDWDVLGFGVCENQNLYVSEQLDKGIRYIELDVENYLHVAHGCACRTTYSINQYFNDVKRYARDHPHQVITVRISDLNDCDGPCLGIGCAYERINGRLEDSGLDAYLYNWNPTVPKTSCDRCYIPDPWPTLREMIDSGKNVMFLHNRDCCFHGVIDEGLFWEDFVEGGNLKWFYDAQELRDLCKMNTVWAPPRSRQQDIPYRLFLVECEPDRGDPGGNERYAAKNNDGRKLYQLAKHQETEILPGGRAVNFIIIDYFARTTAGHLPIDIVDACNRLNYERFGIDWKNSESFWELYPYEFDDSKADYIRQAPFLTAEVEKAIDDFKSGKDLYWNVRTGKIVSTFSQEFWRNFRLIPEWAVDDDFFTRWCGVNWDVDPPYTPPHAWAIDLGESKPVNEIAIAWEYPDHRPGYEVYASNDDRFADGISQEELLDESGWDLVAEGTKVVDGEVLLWDQKTFQTFDNSKWRYIKVKVTDTGGHEWPTFWELRLFGPAR